VSAVWECTLRSVCSDFCVAAEDPSGWFPHAQHFAAANLQAIKLVAALVLGAQLLAIALASWLHSLYEAVYYAWRDDVEEAEQRTRQQLTRAAVASYADDAPASSGWTRRLATKYHVDRSQWEADAAGARQAALLSADDEP
jgi:hypothetical protein